MTTPNKRLLGIIAAAAVLLSVPLIAQFPWKLGDFIAGGVLLFGTGLLCEVVLRLVTRPINRVAICLTILAGLFVIWAELAVGIFGTPFAGS